MYIISFVRHTSRNGRECMQVDQWNWIRIDMNIRLNSRQKNGLKLSDRNDWYIPETNIRLDSRQKNGLKLSDYNTWYIPETNIRLDSRLKNGLKLSEFSTCFNPKKMFVWGQNRLSRFFLLKLSGRVFPAAAVISEKMVPIDLGAIVDCIDDLKSTPKKWSSWVDEQQRGHSR